MEVVNPRELWLAKDGRRSNQSLIIRCALAFSGDAEEKTIRFAPYTPYKTSKK